MSYTYKAGSRGNGCPSPLLILLFAACCGILADRIVGFAPYLSWTASATLLALWKRTSQKSPRISVVLLVLAIACASGCWHHLRWHYFFADHYIRFAPTNDRCRIPMRLIGTVVSRPRFIPSAPLRDDPLQDLRLPTGTRTRFRLDLTAVKPSSDLRSASGFTTVTVQGHLLGVGIGDLIEIDGHLRAVPGPMNPGENDLRIYYRSRRVLGRVEVPYPDSIRILRSGSSHPRFLIVQLRCVAEAILRRRVSADVYPLATALLLGVRDTLPPSLIDSFFRTGTIHLLAISGLHVGILACALLTAARGQLLPWKSGLICVMALTFLYALIAESRAPVVRATLLVQIVCLSWITRRKLTAINALAAAGLIVLSRNPAQLFLVGTQLSFLAVATLGVVGARCVDRIPEDPIERLIWKTRPFPRRIVRRTAFAVGRMTLASLAVWLVTLPLVTYHFHLISPWTVPLNLILWLPLAFSLISGMGIFVFDAWLPPAANLCASICEINLRWLHNSVTFIAETSHSHFWVSGPSRWYLIAFYTGLAICTGLRRLRCSYRAWTILVIIAALGILFDESVYPSRRERMRCTFLSVGHGTCVVVELPDGSVVLYDAGQLGAHPSAVDRVAKALWSRQVRRIDEIIISHADADHFNLLPGLLNRFPARTLFTGVTTNSKSLMAVRRMAAERGMTLGTLVDGCSLGPRAGCRIDILHPPPDGLPDTDNANSIVALVTYRGRVIMLPGDLEKSGMARLLKRPPLDTDLAMAPHHGSLRSDPARFVTWCTPQWLIVSDGDPETMKPLASTINCPLFHTARHGAITVVIDKQGKIEVRPFRVDPEG